MKSTHSEASLRIASLQDALERNRIAHQGEMSEQTHKDNTMQRSANSQVERLIEARDYHRDRLVQCARKLGAYISPGGGAEGRVSSVEAASRGSFEGPSYDELEGAIDGLVARLRQA